MCFIWCISTSCADPQFAQGCPRALIVEIFQSFFWRGSGTGVVPRNPVGLRIRRGFLKSRVTVVPSPFRTSSLTSLVNASSKARGPICFFAHIVFLRLSLSIQYRWRRDDMLSTKL
jgi:hypothetical protein